MDNENQINDIMTSAIAKIKSLAESNTVVGVPFETKDGTLIIPLTKVQMGFVAGGGEYGTEAKNFKDARKYPFAGGSGAGISMQPIGLLQIKEGDCTLIHVDEKSPVEKLLETIPDIAKNITKIIEKGDKNEKKK